MRKLLVIVVGLAALFISSCGSNDAALETAEAVEASTPNPDEAVNDANSEDPVLAVTDDREESFSSPISDALGIDVTPFEDFDIDDANQNIELEIQQCMQDLGFEYTPSTSGSNSMMTIGPSSGLDVEFGTREFAEKYGYGISTFMFDQMNEIPAMDAAEPDPNDAYVQSLSEAGRTAYFEALHGDQSSIFDQMDEETGQPLNPETGEPFTDEELDEAFMLMEPSGCQTTAMGDNPFLLGENGELLQAFEEEFGNYNEDLWERAQADPRMVKLTDEWVRCMADKTYTLDQKEDVFTEVFERMSTVQTSMFSARPTIAMDSIDEDALAAMTEEEREEYFEQFEPQALQISPEAQAEMDELNAWEIALATADFDCSVGHADVMKTVRIELEENFVEENQGAITAFLEAQAAN